MPIKVEEACRTPSKLHQKRKSDYYTLNIQNKEGILKAAREKEQVTYKDRSIRITLDFSIETLKCTKKS